MNGKLKDLFDYYSFNGNKKLDDIVSSTINHLDDNELDMEDLEMVSAAGSKTLYGKNKHIPSYKDE